MLLAQFNTKHDQLKGLITEYQEKVVKVKMQGTTVDAEVWYRIENVLHELFQEYTYLHNLYLTQKISYPEVSTCNKNFKESIAELNSYCDLN